MYGPPPGSVPNPFASMRARLRPMGIGDILDETFRLYRENFTLFVATVAVLAVPALIIVVVLLAATVLGVFQSLLGLVNTPYSTLTPAQQTSVIQAGLALLGIAPVIVLIAVVAWALLTGAMASAIASRYLNRPVTLGEVYRASTRRIGAMLLALVWMVVRIVLFSIAVVAIIAITAAVHLAALGVILYLACIPLAIYFYNAWQLFPQAIVLENVGGVAATKRSRELITGYWWKAFGLFIVTALLVSVLSAVAAVPALIVDAVTSSIAIQTLVGTILRLIVFVLTLPIQVIATTLLFYDLKIRKEAFDLEAMLQQAAPPAPDYTRY